MRARRARGGCWCREPLFLGGVAGGDWSVFAPADAAGGILPCLLSCTSGRLTVCPGGVLF